MSDEVRSIPPIEPVLDPKKDYVEINSYVVFWGLFYAAVFTLAVGYLCLKIGQTVDAFAPVSVLAMGTRTSDSLNVYRFGKSILSKRYTFKLSLVLVRTHWQGLCSSCQLFTSGM